MVTFLTEDKLRAGESLIADLEASGIVLTAAFWYRRDERSYFELGIAGRDFTTAGDFYRKVQEVMGDSGIAQLRLHEIVAIEPKDRILKDVPRLYKTRRKAGSSAVRAREIEGVMLSDVFVYKVARPRSKVSSRKLAPAA